MYRVLIPKRNKEDEFIGWKEIGIARDMADAKRQFGGYPVLERIL